MNPRESESKQELTQRDFCCILLAKTNHKGSPDPGIGKSITSLDIQIYEVTLQRAWIQGGVKVVASCAVALPHYLYLPSRNNKNKYLYHGLWVFTKTFTKTFHLKVLSLIMRL